MSRLLDDWLAGRGLPDTLAIDAHAPLGGPCRAAAFDGAEQAADRAVALMDAHGIDLACVAGGYLEAGADYRLGNDFVAAVCRRAPDRIVGFMALNPNDTRNRLLDELDRMRHEGIRGVTLGSRAQESYPGDGPNLMAVYEFAAEHRMPVLNGDWPVHVLMAISAQFPDAQFVLTRYRNALDPVLQARSNVCASISTQGTLGWLDRGIRSCGAHKFLMSSGGFCGSPAAGIGPVAFAPIGDDEKRLIFGLNAARILAQAGALPSWVKRRYAL
jgi:uncharacterized protein